MRGPPSRRLAQAAEKADHCLARSLLAATYLADTTRSSLPSRLVLSFFRSLLHSAPMIPHMPAPTIRPVDPGPVRRVLLIRPRYLGDICLTLPALDAVRAACPAAQVAYLTERESAPLIEGDPRVDELIVVPRSPGPRENITLIRRVRRFAPDVAFDFFCNP